jgi:hypothetical protein
MPRYKTVPKKRNSVPKHVFVPMSRKKSAHTPTTPKKKATRLPRTPHKKEIIDLTTPQVIKLRTIDLTTPQVIDLCSPRHLYQSQSSEEEPKMSAAVDSNGDINIKIDNVVINMSAMWDKDDHSIETI